MRLLKRSSKRHIELPLFGIVGLLILLSLLIAGSKILHGQDGATMQTSVLHPTPTLPPHRISTGDGSYTITTNTPNQIKFVSPKLGISFYYQSKLQSQIFMAKEVGQKVYVYDPIFGSYTRGYSVEVFSKSPKDGLEAAIQKTILQGYSEKKCLLVQWPSSPASEVMALTIPSDIRGNSLEGAYGFAQKNCPVPYTRVTGLLYFMMDKNHPNKFVFFNIGMDDLPADLNGKTWDETLQFLP